MTWYKTKWIYSRGMNRKNKKVEHFDLIAEIYQMIEVRKATRLLNNEGIETYGNVSFRKVKAHNGDLLNEVCDKLAKYAIGLYEYDEELNMNEILNQWHIQQWQNRQLYQE